MSYIKSLGDKSNGNYSFFENDGTLVFNGNATIWNDINIGGYDLGTGATPPSIINFAGGTIRTYSFAGGTSGTNDELHGSLELLHDYKEGTDIYLHVHWANTTAVSDANGGVVWAVEYTWQNKDDIFAAPITSSDSITNITNPTLAWKHFRSDIVTILGVGKNIGSALMFRIFRNRTASNTYAAGVALLNFGVHYQCDTVGSRTISSK